MIGSFHSFPNSNDIIKNIPRFYEANFLRMNNLGKKMAHLKIKYIGNDFIRHFEQGYKSLVVE